MTRAVRIARAVALTLAALALLVIVAFGILTQTGVGRERLRRALLSRLQDAAHGTVRLGGVGGSLLRGIRLTDLVITDSTGAPFLAVDTLTASYAPWSFVRKRIDLATVRMVNAVVVLDRRPGERWNYERIFPTDTTAPRDTTFGFGDWVVLHDVQLTGTHVVVRTPWQPADSLHGAARDSAIRAALSGATRERVVTVPQGYQQVMDFRSLAGRLPLVRVAQPGTREMLVRVDSLSGIAAPFTPPAAEVRTLAGDFRITSDSVWFRDARARLPGSRLSGSGAYVLEPGDLWLALQGDTVSLADLRWLYPPLPAEGGGHLALRLRMAGDTSVYHATNALLRTRGAVLSGRLGLALGGTVRFSDTDLHFQGVDTRLIEQLAPVETPRRGTLAGRLALAGPVTALRVDGDVTFDDALAGERSHVAGAGLVGFTARGIRAEALRLHLDPVQLTLVRAVRPTFPMEGAVTGTATLDGESWSAMGARVDLAYRDPRARGESRVSGSARVVLAGARSAHADLRLHPLALRTLRAFAPGVRFRGRARGTITADGPLSDLRIASDLRLPAGGTMTVRGALDVDHPEPGYAATVALGVVDLNSIVANAPATRVTAHATAQGRGVQPSTMHAAVALEMAASMVDSLSLTGATLRAAVDGGMLHMDTLAVRSRFATVGVAGTLGVVAGQRGTLRVHALVDSLSGLARYIAVVDTAVVAPRPAARARMLARARRDSTRRARRLEVARAAMASRGRAMPAARVGLDTTSAAVRADSVSGAAALAATITGSVQRFDARGRVAASNVVVRGNAMASAQAEFAWMGGPRTSGARLVAGARLDRVRAAGFELDTVSLRATYQAPNGTVSFRIAQDTLRDYTGDVAVTVHLNERELHVRQMALRFDTTTWRAAHPGTIRWGPRGVAIDSLDLRSGANGRIFVDGRLPTAGNAALTVDVRGLQVAHVFALLQSDLDVAGLLTMRARLEGTEAAPRFTGAAALMRGSVGTTRIPDLRTTFAYDARHLRADAVATRGVGEPLLLANADIPVDLALSGHTGARLLEQPLRVDVRMDSLPLDAVPQFTDVITELRGQASGAVAVRGTPHRIGVAGAVGLHLASFRLAATGNRVTNLNGMARMHGDTLVIDSLVGRSGGGVLRVTGGLDVSRLTHPGFALTMTARNATVMDNERGRVVANADIAVSGPFDSVLVRGRATILEGTIYAPEPGAQDVMNIDNPAFFSALDTARVSEDVLPKPNPLLEHLRVEVALDVLRDTWVRRSDANVEISSSGELTIRMDRRRQSLVVEGIVNTERGDYTFLTRRFDVQHGTITFTGDPEVNPTLQLTATHEIRLPGREPIDLQVIVGGTMLEPRVTLQSDAQPPISQSDLLSYLAFGRSSSSLLQFRGSSLSGPGSANGPVVGQVAALATQQLTTVAIGLMADEFERSAAQSLNADVLTITPTDIPTELSASGIGGVLKGTEVEVGRYLNRRTFVAVQARPTLAAPGARLQYRMGDGLRLETSFEPRFQLRAPSLETNSAPARTTTVFGLFLVRDWRF
ncbi:MAG TPA: translocation/assembly module TamB domain-containing protein [Gemmatimonadaceae bacterium]|nr:translocation/assembly module TamB domain-containing protein [Gemmatimonadaceae bacterium]